jgi:hypothetical protein
LLSGFTFVRNAGKLYYPIGPAIASILPIVDEFVVALGDCDPDDDTLTQILALRSSKIRILDTVWDTQTYPNGTENAHQTDLAKAACRGEWLFYLQADEVVHERYLPHLRRLCEELLPFAEVEGLLFDYKHFWGDYQHYHIAHGWYPEEIRIIRNRPDIHSWESAQSFRRIPNFDGHSYRQQAGTHKLKVLRAGAEVYHYGWVRPPRLMVAKTEALNAVHHGSAKAQAMAKAEAPVFDYGPLGKLGVFRDGHPAVMQAWIAQLDWQHQLRKGGPIPKRAIPHKHEKLKNRLLGWVEQNLLGGRPIFGFKNYQLLPDPRRR